MQTHAHPFQKPPEKQESLLAGYSYPLPTTSVQQQTRAPTHTKQERGRGNSAKEVRKVTFHDGLLCFWNAWMEGVQTSESKVFPREALMFAPNVQREMLFSEAHD